MAGESAIRPYVPEPSILKTPVPAVDCEQFDAEAALGRTTAFMTDRYAQFGIAAALDAWQDAGLSLGSPPEERVRGAVCWGTGLGGTRQSSWPTSTCCRGAYSRLAAADRHGHAQRGRRAHRDAPRPRRGSDDDLGGVRVVRDRAG